MSAAAPAVAASVYECSGKNGQTTTPKTQAAAIAGRPTWAHRAFTAPPLRLPFATQKHPQQRTPPTASKTMCSARRKNWRRHKRIWRPADKCAMAMSAIMSAISSAFRGWSKPCKTRVRNWSKPKAGK